MPQPQPQNYTYADLLLLDESDRIELINGQPVMFPAPFTIHQRISRVLTVQLGNYLLDKTCEVYAAPYDVRLFEQDGDRPEDVDTVVQPDIMVICDPDKIDDRGCKGAPDFIIEILSPSSLRHDKITKFNLYMCAGVREYWIVDPQQKNVQIFALENGRYMAKALISVDEPISVGVLDGCVIDLTSAFQA